jgi:hypothetical protein
MMRSSDAVTERYASGTGESYHARRIVRWTWSPAQLVGFVVGLVFVVLGGVAVARTGVDFQHLTLKHVQVAGVGHTQLLGYLEIGFGLLMLGAAAVADGGRGFMTFLGLVALAFGLIVAIQPSSFRRSLGVAGGGYGIFLAVVGAIVVLVSLVSPDFGGGSWTTRRTELRPQRHQ